MEILQGGKPIWTGKDDMETEENFWSIGMRILQVTQAGSGKFVVHLQSQWEEFIFDESTIRNYTNHLKRA